MNKCSCSDLKLSNPRLSNTNAIQVPVTVPHALFLLSGLESSAISVFRLSLQVPQARLRDWRLHSLPAALSTSKRGDGDLSLEGEGARREKGGLRLELKWRRDGRGGGARGARRRPQAR